MVIAPIFSSVTPSSAFAGPKLVKLRKTPAAPELGRQTGTQAMAKGVLRSNGRGLQQFQAL